MSWVSNPHPNPNGLNFHLCHMSSSSRSNTTRARLEKELLKARRQNSSLSLVDRLEVQASKHEKVKADLASERRFINSVGVRKRARCGAPRHLDDKHVISNTKKRLKRKAVSVRAFAESLQGDDELGSILAVVRAQP